MGSQWYLLNLVSPGATLILSSKKLVGCTKVYEAEVCKREVRAEERLEALDRQDSTNSPDYGNVDPSLEIRSPVGLAHQEGSAPLVGRLEYDRDRAVAVFEGLARLTDGPPRRLTILRTDDDAHLPDT